MYIYELKLIIFNEFNLFNKIEINLNLFYLINHVCISYFRITSEM